MSALFTTPLRRDCLAWTAALWAAILVVPTAWVLVTGSIPIWVAPGALMGTALTWAVMTGLLGSRPRSRVPRCGGGHDVRRLRRQRLPLKVGCRSGATRNDP